MPCASPRHFLRRTDHILRPLGCYRGSFGSTHTSNEQSVTSKDNTLVSILHKVADTVLSVARSVQGLDGNALSDLELFAMRRGLGN